VPVLYSGSADAGNAAVLLQTPGVDGLLVGGTSLRAATFAPRHQGGGAMIALCLSRGMPAPIVRRRYADSALECAAQHVRVGKSAARCDLLGRVIAVFEHPARCFDPSDLDPGRRCHPDLGPEHAGEVPRAYIQPLG
jgi:hypothetical protein